MRSAPFALACAFACVTSGCAGFTRWPWGSTQRWPGPMEAKANPLPAGDAVRAATGPEEVLVVRHADPVQVRPAGLSSSFPLSFYDKDIRVNAGATVYSAPGGRVEILWPDGSSIVMFGRGTGFIGSPSRGETAFSFREVERAMVQLNREEEIELYGGAHLVASSGPFILDHTRADILRVKNQAKSAGRISFRESVFTLDPGQAVDLPLLSAGASPAPRDSGLSVARASGFTVQFGGAVDLVPLPDAVELHARGEHEIHGLGVSIRLTPGESVRFRGLERASEPGVPIETAPVESPPTATPPAARPTTVEPPASESPPPIPTSTPPHV